MTVEEIKASEAYRKVGSGYLIVRADELNRLIRENLALKRDLQIAANDGDRECGLCTAWNNGYMSACCEACSGDCSLFEWRGIVPENEPADEEVEKLRRRLVERDRR